MKHARLIIVVFALAGLLAACGTHRELAQRAHVESVRAAIPPPTENWLDADAEKRNKKDREAWFEHMHRTAPDVDWRAIESDNGRAEQFRRNLLARTMSAGTATHWTEVGSSNLAGRMHVAVIGPDGQKIYGGSSLGGLWRANLDGTAWEPLGDNLYGGVHDLAVLPGETTGAPDVVVAVTDGGLVHVSRDEGLSWEEPTGASDLWEVRGIAVLQDLTRTILIFARGPDTGYVPTVLASTDYGRTFVHRGQGTPGWTGWMWVPRTGAGAVNQVFVVDAGRILISTDGGRTFPTVRQVAPGADRGVLTGSEAGAPTLYAAFRTSGQWKLYRSDDAGLSWIYTHDISDFWESLCASTRDEDLVFYGGVEAFRSTNGGNNFSKVNLWWEYYDDIVNMLHADIPGIHCWPDPTSSTQESCYVSTDGGLYRSHDGLDTVLNISLSGLGVSQYYSTFSSRADWDRIAAGAQDQGYQLGTVQHTPESGPSTPLEQLISGDYGHLTSTDGTHDLVFSTYPGFTLVQDGTVDPVIRQIDFPDDSLHAWLPPVVADPLTEGTFYFCGDWLYRFDRLYPNHWGESLQSHQQFGGPGVTGNYLSALAFAPTDPDRAYAVNDAGRLFYSTDHGENWTESTDSAPPQHYFYGNAITVHPTDALEVAVGGSGYSAAGVIRSTDGGQTWIAETAGLPQTLVYSLVYAEDGSGDLYAGTETGAYRWSRQTGLWENIMANEAPVTIYWSVESVYDGGTIRYGTYGRGAWDYVINPGDRDGDGVPDELDLCANNVDPDQFDDDGDGLGNACDNCTAVDNVDQANSDGDPAGDACDCNPADPNVFFVPPEVEGLRWPSRGVLEWDSAAPQSGNETEHIVIRGTLGQFPVGSSSDCDTNQTSGTSSIEFGLPGTGTGFWYLVHGTNSCGTGTLGSWGTGTERTIPACDP